MATEALQNPGTYDTARFEDSMILTSIIAGGGHLALNGAPAVYPEPVFFQRYEEADDGTLEIKYYV